VRNLAQRSAEAAKDIKTLIDDSVNRIDAGSRLAAESSESLTKIVASVAEVSAIVTEIATASNEQSNGITQVNRAVEQMDSVTQRNAAQVEETAAATTTMSRQAEDMMALMDFFKVDSGNQWQPVSDQSVPVAMSSTTPATKVSAPVYSTSKPSANGRDDEWQDF
jgi:methyl-accepting chemotaxis protein